MIRRHKTNFFFTSSFPFWAVCAFAPYHLVWAPLTLFIFTHAYDLTSHINIKSAELCFSSSISDGIFHSMRPNSQQFWKICVSFLPLDRQNDFETFFCDSWLICCQRVIIEVKIPLDCSDIFGGVVVYFERPRTAEHWWMIICKKVGLIFVLVIIC